MLAVFLEVVLPVALVAIIGGAVGRWRGVSVAPLSALTFYLFSPSLVFYSMMTTQVSAGLSLRIFAVLGITYVGMYIAASLWSWGRHHDAPMRAAFAIGATTPNLGNMGIPVAQLAFGSAGLEIAVLNFVAGNVISNSAGVAIASTVRGGTNFEVLRAPLRYPYIYAAAAGLLINISGIDLPVTLEAPARTLASASIPVMLVVLGLQLQNAGGRDYLLDTLVVNLGRLIIAPGVAWLAAGALGLEGVTRGTVVVLAAMPTAVIATIIATEFGALPAFVTRIVVTTTLSAMLTLSLLIYLVR